MARSGAGKREGKFWEQALQRAKLGLWDVDLVSGECFYSATWGQMLGYSEGELAHSGDLWLTLTHPDDREQAIASGDRHLAGLTDIIETELRLRHKDGHWVWVLDRGGVVERDGDGSPLRMIGVQTDITKQKAVEGELAKVNARFRLALAASGTGIWHHDIDAKRSVWDERTRAIYGIPEHSSDVPAELWHTFLHPDDKEEVERAHLSCLDADAVVTVRYRIVLKTGETRHIDSLVRFVADPHSSGQILGTVRDVTEQERRQQELAFAARHDALTGLLNRAAFDALLRRELGETAKLPLAVFYIDLDYFKALNDFAGHAAGDAALRAIAAAIGACLPQRAHAARLGGDEFAVLAPNCPDPKALAETLLAAIRGAELGVHAGPRKLAASIGVTSVRDTGTSVADAMACADDACYAAKASGRNAYAIFSEHPTASTSGLNAARLASETMDALEEGRLLLFAQELRPLAAPWSPCAQAEILARLVGRDGRTVSPGEFIPAAERFGLAPRLDRWIFETALTRYSGVMRSTGLTLGFNLSAQTLSDPDLWGFVDDTIARTDAPCRGIVFEITETAAVTSFEAAERFVAQARERRCRVSLDDFGAGLSSFEYLRRFPVDSIKINGSFVENMAASRFDREIVAAIHGIARSLGYKVVAEKIEQPEALELLRAMGVDFGQGFLMHRPEPLEAIVARLSVAETVHEPVQLRRTVRKRRA